MPSQEYLGLLQHWGVSLGSLGWRPEARLRPHATDHGSAWAGQVGTRPEPQSCVIVGRCQGFPERLPGARAPCRIICQPPRMGRAWSALAGSWCLTRLCVAAWAAPSPRPSVPLIWAHTTSLLIGSQVCPRQMQRPILPAQSTPSPQSCLPRHRHQLSPTRPRVG